MTKKNKQTFAVTKKQSGGKAREFIAIHEAGHCVADAIFGVQIDYCQATKKQGFTGSRTEEWANAQTDLPREEVFARVATMAMAGIAAEGLIGADWTPELRAACAGDAAQVSECIAPILGRSCALQPRVFNAITVECFKVASDLVHRCWNTTNRICDLLLAAGRDGCAVPGKFITDFAEQQPDILAARAAWESERMGEKLVARIREIAGN